MMPRLPPVCGWVCGCCGGLDVRSWRNRLRVSKLFCLEKRSWVCSFLVVPWGR